METGVATERQMQEDFRQNFSELSALVDADQSAYLDSVGLGTPFFWFECLANYINKEMNREVPPNEYQQVFKYFRSTYLFSTEEVRECIDVSFIENLFHNVSTAKATPYWTALPDLLCDLYINFHHRSPC